jgi:hypothetical protein
MRAANQSEINDHRRDLQKHELWENPTTPPPSQEQADEHTKAWRWEFYLHDIEQQFRLLSSQQRADEMLAEFQANRRSS